MDDEPAMVGPVLAEITRNHKEIAELQRIQAELDASIVADSQARVREDFELKQNFKRWNTFINIFRFQIKALCRAAPCPTVLRVKDMNLHRAEASYWMDLAELLPGLIRIGAKHAFGLAQHLCPDLRKCFEDMNRDFYAVYDMATLETVYLCNNRFRLPSLPSHVSQIPPLPDELIDRIFPRPLILWSLYKPLAQD